ncbi:MAG TPA: bifunctional diaminohydroxyphosphoribosylaminopyrimidine deaminase/5-amino-6-(5-phosphoribosylamino)uracil reductase RibD [Bacteroidales bacterium]|nr:bifunctional diaminohydroxyphosphoribosylaminopyrimidine deaminase/5-amino-6-(5-phosphoribosylamino)uracil reductase RibD [Bacteroidales bacterium]
MTESEDIKFMRRCLELASCAEGMTYPNPVVGSVIVHEGKITGEGYHQRAGMPHAEVNAINSVNLKDQLKRSTLYVNLEPCSHFGKTPPCADFIIENSIPRVVVGATDTSSRVGGTGIKKLREAGISVTTGVLEKESRWINRRFFTFNEKKRPWIILKWARSIDGFIDIERKPFQKGPNWISGKPERVLVHKWRSAEQAILVGAGTIKADNPRLNVREWKGENPVPLILSSSGEVSVQGIENRKIVFTHNRNAKVEGAEIALLNANEPSCIQVAEFLYREGIQSLFIEGGAQVLSHFLQNGLWDEARIFTGNTAFGKGVLSPEPGGTLLSEKQFDGSRLEVYLNETF